MKRTAPARVGQGSAEQPRMIGPGLMVESVPAINQRGYAINLAEENLMMTYLVGRQGGVQTSGDYKVAYMSKGSEGWYEDSDGQLAWRNPAPGETIHLEIIVLDSLTGKTLPVASPTLELTDAQGKVLETHELIFLWHPMADHYGWNYSVPAGTYNLHFHAEIPNMARHSRELGQRFKEPMDITFQNVRLDAGRQSK